MSYCLTPLTVDETKELIGHSFDSAFQLYADYVIKPLRRNIKLGRSLGLDKLQWEYFVADAITNAVHTGAGKSIIDVKIGDDIGIDVKGLQSQNKNQTTEASMFQTISQAAKASAKFQKRDTQELWNLYISEWYKKLSTIKKYYLLVIVRDKKSHNCSVIAFKFNPDNFPEYSPDSFDFLTSKGKVTSAKITSLVDPNLLQIKIYSGKTRIEMRVQTKLIKDANYTYPVYDFSLDAD
jgi:hypothetical protein